MKTGAHLKIESFGSNALGVKLLGNPQKPEPDSFRVEFPGGVVDLERCVDGSYWVHIIASGKARIVDQEGPASGTYSSMHITTMRNPLPL